MKKIDKTAIIEGLKELLRTFLMPVVPLIIVDLQSGVFNYKNWLIAGGIAVLSAVDKWLHKKDIGVAGNGLTGI